MRLVAAGFLKVRTIDLLDDRIFMTLTEGRSFVLLIQGLRTQGTEILEVTDVAGLIGLTTAIDTAAWAAHDFNKVIILLTGLTLSRSLQHWQDRR